MKYLLAITLWWNCTTATETMEFESEFVARAMAEAFVNQVNLAIAQKCGGTTQCIHEHRRSIRIKPVIYTLDANGVVQQRVIGNTPFKGTLTNG